MKRFAVAFFVIAFFFSNLAAQAASATFATRTGETFQLLLNGRIINGRGSSQVRIDKLPAGPHNIEFRVPARRGFLTYCTRIFLDRGFETNYILILPGYNPNFMLKKVNMVPLHAPVCNTCPAPPRPGHGHPKGYDFYDDFDGYGQGGNYGQQGSGYGQQGGNYQHGQGQQHGGNHGQGNYSNGPGYGNNFNNQPANVMTSYDVNLLVESMRRKSFESAKADIAKQALSNQFIMAEDVKKLMEQFSFESSRVDFAKFVHPKVYDQQNFYRVYDAFDFDSSTTEMNRWLKR